MPIRRPGEEAGLGAGALVGNGGDGHAGADLAVLGVQAVGVGDEDVVVHIQQAAGGLDNGCIVVLGGKVTGLQNVDLFLVGNGGGAGDDGVDVTEEALAQHDLHLGRALAQGLRCLFGAADQAGLGGIDGGSHDTSQALVNTHGRTGDDGVADIVHLVCDHGNGVVDGIFSEDLCVVGTGGGGDLQNPLTYISCDHGIAPFLLV